MKKEALRELILHILNKVDEMSKVKLAKLILLAEVTHFEKTGKSITGLYFVRLTYGPVIAFFDEVLEQYKGDLWEETLRDIPIYEEGRLKKQHLYRALKTIKAEKEIEETISTVIKEYGKKTGTELSNLSHSLPAWKYSEPNEPIYIAELAVKDEKEYFALIDLLEDTNDDDHLLGEKISRALPPK